MTEAPAPDRSFGRECRIISTFEFKAIFARRKAVRTRGAIVYWRPSESGVSRLGLSVGRRNGNAVHRNRIKRVWREVFRLHKDRLPCALDLVFVPGDPARCADFHESVGLFREVLHRLTKDVAKADGA